MRISDWSSDVCSSDLRSTASVQGSLVMYPLLAFGSEKQKQKYLPKLADGSLMGCFGLTEPDHGSDPGGMTTSMKDDGDYVVLTGAKMWISNAPFADIAIVWAKIGRASCRERVCQYV